MYVYTWIKIYSIYSYTCTHKYMNVYINMYINTYIYTHTHIYEVQNFDYKFDDDNDELINFQILLSMLLF